MREKIYNLLMVTHRGLLENCYRQVFSGDGGLQAAKTFEDYLDDFYLYLYEAKPKYIKDDVKGYYLQQIRDEKATPSWLWQTFKRFLLEENATMTEMREALAEYRRQLAAAEDGRTVDITLTHVGFAIAWFNQHESGEDRYLFFRSAYKHFMGFYTWPSEELDDGDVAAVLGISQGNLRTRTSRLCAKVKRMVGELNDALISSLNKQALDIARKIYADPFPKLQNILEELLGQAERELEQYDQIVALRREKRISAAMLFDRIDASYCAKIADEEDMADMAEAAPMAEISASPAGKAKSGKRFGKEGRIVARGSLNRIPDLINRSKSSDSESYSYSIPDHRSEVRNSIIRKFKELIGM